MKYTFSAVARSGLFVLGALAGTTFPAFAGPMSVPHFNIPGGVPDAPQPPNAVLPADGRFDGMVQFVRDGGGWHGGGGWHRGGGWNGGGWRGGGWNGHGWRGGGWHRGGWYGGGWYGGWDGDAFALGLGLGLAAPLYAYRPYNYDPIYVQPSYPRYAPVGLSRAHMRWCYNRYRSYSVYTNTFQPYNGPRQQCFSPYG